VQGTVLDESLAVIPGSELTLRVKATNVTLKTIASGEGAFRFAGVPTGAAELTARMPGFSIVHTSLDVSSDGVSGLRIKLPASAVSEQVAVSASAEMLQVNRATQSASITSKELQALPTASRNYTHLIAGEAGVSAALPDRTGAGSTSPPPRSQGDDGTQSSTPA
jgi:hypothetical protein